MKNEMKWSEAKLPFPLKASGTAGIEVYEIPEEKKLEVLKALYPFDGCPRMDEELFDLHSEKKFVVNEFLVIRSRNQNLVVSPWYFEGGGTVMDWVIPPGT